MRIATLLTATALSLTLGLGAVQAASPGLNQIAASLGVNADNYTAAQLTRLSTAVSDNDAQEISYVLSLAGKGDASSVSAVPSTSAAATQMALIENVEPGRFTLNELQQLSQARKDNNQDAVDYILSGANREVRGAVGEVSPGMAQLAALLGVDAANYSNADLAKLVAESVNSND